MFCSKSSNSFGMYQSLNGFFAGSKMARNTRWGPSPPPSSVPGLAASRVSRISSWPGHTCHSQTATGTAPARPHSPDRGNVLPVPARRFISNSVHGATGAETGHSVHNQFPAEPRRIRPNCSRASFTISSMTRASSMPGALELPPRRQESIHLLALPDRPFAAASGLVARS